MSENIYQRATLSVFESNLRRGIDGPVTFLELERRGKQLSEEYSRKEYANLLKDGIAIGVLGSNFVAQISEEVELKGGIIKWLSRLTAKTTSPKSGRKTVYRKDSTVIERSRQPDNWRTGSKAEEQKLLQRTVSFTPLEEWLENQSQNKKILKKEERDRIAMKRNSRVAKAMSQWENNSNNEYIARSVIQKVVQISEKNGVRNIDQLETMLMNNLNKGISQPIIFIWGPPYENQGKKQNSFIKGQPEYKMLLDIENVLDILEETGLQTKPILIYADLYGSQINGIPQAELINYLEEIVKNSPINFIITSISEILLQNNLDNFYSSDDSSPSIEETRSAKKIQLKLGRNISDKEAFLLASIYRTARLNEGRLLSEGFYLNGERIEDVIKLATASNKEKDDPYEPNLPRFYVKKMYRAAWNKPRVE